MNDFVCREEDAEKDGERDVQREEEVCNPVATRRDSGSSAPQFLLQREVKFELLANDCELRADE